MGNAVEGDSQVGRRAHQLRLASVVSCASFGRRDIRSQDWTMRDADFIAALEQLVECDLEVLGVLNVAEKPTF